jgi:hypothetical protein
MKCSGIEVWGLHYLTDSADGLRVTKAQQLIARQLERNRPIDHPSSEPERPCVVKRRAVVLYLSATLYVDAAIAGLIYNLWIGGAILVAAVATHALGVTPR